MKIRKNDTVLVITGKDKGKTGKVRFAYPKHERIIVEGINLVKKHSKASQAAGKPGIIEREASIAASNVMFLCNRCKHPSRIGDRVLNDGRTVRVCHSCSEVVD